MKDFWKTKHIENSPLWLSFSKVNELRSLHKTPGMINKNILEIGVGDGLSIISFAQNNKVSAVDITEVALEKVKTLATIYLTENMEDIPSNSIDYAFCNLVFQHCDDVMATRLIEQTLRCLKGDAIFSFQTADCWKQNNHVIQCMKEGPLFWRSIDKMVEIINNAGGETSYISSPIMVFDNGGQWNIVHCKKQPQDKEI